jgi:hypothetical protein
MNSMELKHALERPFPTGKVSWRVGSTNSDKSKGLALAYVDARDVMHRLDEVCGVDGWQCRYSLAADGLLICDVGIWSEARKDWIWKANGAGATDVEAEKGKASDAFKRAAVLWGVGRYLYSLDSPWVELDDKKRIKTPPTLPKWATPEGYDDILKQRKAA